MKETHSLRGFARLVADLRRAEMEADRTCLEADLDCAAVLRRRVDAAVREILAPTLYEGDDDDG